MAARRPTPTALRKLRGAQASKTNRREPVPPLGLGPVPDGWKGEAARFFMDWAPVLEASGMAAQTDRPIFEQLCNAHADTVELRAIRDREGQLYVSPGGLLKVNPVCKLLEQAEARKTRLLLEFGLSPASRAKVFAVPPARKGFDDPFLAQFYPRLPARGAPPPGEDPEISKFFAMPGD